MLHDPPSPNCCRFIHKLIHAKIMGGVFHETFVSLVTFEVYLFKVSNLLCWKEELLPDIKPMLRQIQEESGRLKEATPSGFLALFDSFQYSGENISKCSLLPLRRSVYMPSMEVQECPIFEVERSRTHRHMKPVILYSIL